MRRGLSAYAGSHNATLTGACRDQASPSRSCSYRVIHRHLGPHLKILCVENGSICASISVCRRCPGNEQRVSRPSARCIRIIHHLDLSVSLLSTPIALLELDNHSVSLVGIS